MNFEVDKYYKYKKGLLWYFMMLLVFGYLSYTAYTNGKQYFELIIYAIFLIGLVVYILLKPGKVTLSFDPNSLKIGDEKFFYRDMLGYMVVHEREITFLHFFTKNKWRPTIKITMDTTEAIKAIDFVSDYVTYLPDEKEPLVDLLQRLLRF